MKRFDTFYLPECHDKSLERVGNKARNLGKIMNHKQQGYRNDFEVPNGVVVDSNFWRYVYGQIEPVLDEKLKDLRIAKSREEIQSMAKGDPFFNKDRWIILENLTDTQFEKKREALKTRLSEAITQVLRGCKDDILSVSDKFRTIAEWPDNVEAVYIRSSTDISDTKENPHAGIFGSTPIWKDGISDLSIIIDVIRYCFLVIFHQIGYLAEKGINISDINLALIYQVYAGLEIEKSGVVHVPTVGKKNEITVQGGWGVCSYFVKGQSGDTYLVDVQLNKSPSFRVSEGKCIFGCQDRKHTINSEMAHTFDITVGDEAEDIQKISDHDLLRIAKISWHVKEEIFDHPQIIEFSVKKDDTILIIQSRPQPGYSY